jgi:glyoxylase-like metal-dependent hydrolase (beta-lactamase superfamily II)
MSGLENLVWSPLAGVKGVQIFPFIRKVDIVSSNSYLLDAEDRIVLVDPGGLPEQADLLFAEIQKLLDRKPRQVIICLTHVHLDHCHQLLHHPGLQSLPARVVAVQEWGAQALEKGDRSATIADLIQQELSAIKVDISLLSDCDRGFAREEKITLGGIPCITCKDPLGMEDGSSIPRQTLPLTREAQLEFLHTPGHSPDSICIRAGEAFFIGDLLFATAPGVAGLTGWDQAALLSTIDRVSLLLSRGGISVCLPGHGRPMDVPATLRTLAAMKKEALQLSGIERIDRDWARETARYAEDLMNEVERLFTIIAGRLVYVAHMLDELEEAGEAERLRTLIDADLVDDILADFNNFSLECRTGSKLDIHLALKAGQISGKLDRIYRGELLGSMLNLSLVRRVGRLLEDYTITFRGFRPHINVLPTDLSIAAGEVVTSATNPPYQEDAIVEAEDEEAFARALALRIAYVNPFEHLVIDYSPGVDLPLVLLDKDRFGDVLLFLLEKFSTGGADNLRIAARPSGRGIGVVLEAPVFSGRALLDERSLRFACRSVALSGGSCAAGGPDGIYRITLEYPALGTEPDLISS